MLVLVTLRVSSATPARRVAGGLAIGATLCFLIAIFGPISGASFNPVRSIAPACIAGSFDFLWIYVAGPMAGGALAVGACRLFGADDCCARCGVRRIDDASSRIEPDAMRAFEV